MKTSSLSRREKLLLTLLTSALIFSASFSYGAVNQAKVDSIMKMITDGGAKFSDIPVSGQTKSERTQYFEKVDAGLGDAVEMLAVVRNNIRSLMGLSPAYTADDIVGSILGGVMSGVSGNGNSGNASNPANPGQSAAQVLGIFANTPIPAPCPANTIVMKEDLGKPGAGMWLHKTWNNKNPSLGTYHVYKLTLKESATTYKEMLKLEPSPRVVFDSAETNGVVGGTNYTHIKISPYPCDFVSQSELDAAKAQGYGFRGTFGACGHSNLDVTYKIDGVDDPKNTGSCTLKLGGTYYVNVGPSPSLSNTPESGYTYSIHNRTSYTDPAGLYGIYPFVKDANGVSTNPQYDAWKEKTNSSGENAETLRQAVVNSYKSQIGSPATGGPGPVSNSAGSSATVVTPPGGKTCEQAGVTNYVSVNYMMTQYSRNLATIEGNGVWAMEIVVPPGTSSKGWSGTVPRLALSQLDTNGFANRTMTLSRKCGDFSSETAIVLSTNYPQPKGYLITNDDPRTSNAFSYGKVTPGERWYLNVRNDNCDKSGFSTCNFAYTWTNAQGTVNYNTYGDRCIKETDCKPYELLGLTPPQYPNSPWENMGNIGCPGGNKYEDAQKAYPNANGYWWTNVVPGTSGATSNSWWNVKDKNKLTDESLPATCTTGKEFIKHTTSYHCDRYVCRN